VAMRVMILSVTGHSHLLIIIENVSFWVP